MTCPFFAKFECQFSVLYFSILEINRTSSIFHRNTKIDEQQIYVECFYFFKM